VSRDWKPDGHCAGEEIRRCGKAVFGMICEPEDLPDPHPTARLSEGKAGAKISLQKRGGF
jgi:hypothetical protein